MEEMIHEKYMAEVEAHADIILQICKDYGKEIGEAIHLDIGSGEAEKMMLLGVVRYTLDRYMDGSK